MRKQFLIHKLNANYLVVDINEVGGEPQFLPGSEFTSWKMLEDRFLRMGAAKPDLDKAKEDADSKGTAHLLI
jgi:hypothetical protein